MGSHHHTGWIVGSGVLILVIAFVLVIFVYPFRSKRDASNAAAAQEQNLQSLLVTAQHDNSNATIASTTSQLVTGAKSGQYTLSNDQLATYSMEEGTAELNLQNYSQALTAFQAAAKLDQADQFGALQGEVQAGYALGERQQLIPLLKQLVILAGQSGNAIAGSPQQYQKDISEIENNQPVEF